MLLKLRMARPAFIRCSADKETHLIWKIRIDQVLAD